MRNYNSVEIEHLYKEMVDKKEEYHKKQRKAFTYLMKEVLAKDTRFTIVPQPSVSLLGNDITSDNILGDVMLQREGTLAPVIIQPLRNAYGIVVDCGSKRSSVIFSGYPSQHLAWSMITMTNELERQFTREVAWESNKHGTILPTERKSYAKTYHKRTSH